jgi:hypothetical protein
LLHGKIDCNDVLTGVTVQDLEPAESCVGGRYRFDGPIVLDRGGAFGYTVREIPRNDLLTSVAEPGVVAVPAVLPQQRRRVPEPGHRFLGHVERPEPCVQLPAVGRRADRCSGGEVGNPHQSGGVGELPDRLPQRGGAAPPEP